MKRLSAQVYEKKWLIKPELSAEVLGQRFCSLQCRRIFGAGALNNPSLLKSWARKRERPGACGLMEDVILVLNNQSF